jgi:hypothetical protein
MSCWIPATSVPMEASESARGPVGRAAMHELLSS